jgi:hypothetical protein
MTRRLSLHATQPAGPMLPASGDLVAGKYRIERKLGRGGMGAVFAVTHSVTGRRFAIKWLLATGAEGAHGIKRFVREAQIAGRIQHPHVVDVFDIYQEETGIFLVMELLEGEALSNRLAREGCLGAREACRIMLPCAAGVAAAHARGVVHRDLKPANIFLCKTPDDSASPKVLDFGISQLAAADLSDTTERRSGTVVGTPYYMAPEQLRAEGCDQRVDVYALGVTLYEMLSGKRPFEAVSYAELVLKIVRGNPTPLDVLVPELPAGLVAVVARAMHHEPEARYASVDALIHALEPFAQESEPAAHGGRVRRRAASIVPLVACGALIVAAAVGWIYANPRAAPAAPPGSIAHAQAEPDVRRPDIPLPEPALATDVPAPAIGAPPNPAPPAPTAPKPVRRRAAQPHAPLDLPLRTASPASEHRGPRLQLNGI